MALPQFVMILVNQNNMEQYTSANARPRHTVLNVLLFLLLVQVFLTAICNRISSPDLFLGFAAGAKILQQGPAFPDTWSFTASGKVWVDQSWSSHLILAVSLRTFGPSGPVALKVLLLAGCLGLLFAGCRKLGVSAATAFFTLSFATMAAGPFLGIRAENFGIFYFVLFLIALSQADHNVWVRRIGLPLVIIIWSNSHGSFMLGLGLLVVKIGILVLRKFVEGWTIFRFPVTWRTVREWTLVCLISVILTAVATPFGPENLLMPFRQLGTELVTSHSVDWLPLLDIEHMNNLVGPGSVYGYLLFLLVVLCAGLFALVMKERDESIKHASSSSTNEITNDQEMRPEEPSRAATRTPLRTDWVMEGAIVLITTLLAFRFRRFIIFASFALVPTASVIFSLSTDRLLTASARLARSQLNVRRLWIATSICVLLMTLAMTWFFYRSSVLPYHPENPLRPSNRSLARDLMSYDRFSQPLISFLISNKIDGNVLAGWEISSFLLHELPNVKVFMDPRDQSFYPEKVIRDFFTIMGVVKDTQASRFSLLDRYAVTTVVMTTYPYDFNLAKDLVQSRQWGCIYRDDHSVVLVRSHSSRFKEMLAESDFKNLWYPDEATRVRSEAFQSLLSSGEIRGELVKELKEVVIKRPFPDLYGLIVVGLNGSEKCLQPPTVQYLLSELARLNVKSPLYRNGVEEVTESRLAILGLLEANARECGTPEEYSRFATTKNSVERARSALLKYYKGQLF